MPVSIKEIKNYEINNVLSSTKEDLEKLTDIELTTISDILRFRKKYGKNHFVIENLLESLHYIIMDFEQKERDRVKITNDYNRLDDDDIKSFVCILSKLSK